MDYLKGKPSPDASTGGGNAGVGGTQLSKSLWTCAVESSIEYCRIVWDLFPGKKHVRFIVSDTAAHIVNTWSGSTQNMSHVSNAMMMVSVPSRSIPQSSDYSVIHGLRAAIEALAEPTDEQMHAAQIGCKKITNEGRVICITSARDNTSMKSKYDRDEAQTCIQHLCVITRFRGYLQYSATTAKRIGCAPWQEGFDNRSLSSGYIKHCTIGS